MSEQLYAVWPNVEGLDGINHQSGQKVKLAGFQKGYMYESDALKAEKAGKVQLMAGLSPQQLSQPGDNKSIKRKLTGYEKEAKRKTAAEKREKTAAASKKEYETKVMIPSEG